MTQQSAIVMPIGVKTYWLGHLAHTFNDIGLELCPFERTICPPFIVMDMPRRWTKK